MADDEEQALAEPLMTLSNIGRSPFGGEGTGMAYRTLVCVGRRIGALKLLEGYAHLQHIDLSRNLIKDVAPLKHMQNVLKLNLAQNSISSLKAWEQEEGSEVAVLPRLNHLDLSCNAFTSLTPLSLKALRTVSFAKNEITTVAEMGGHGMLEMLDLSANKLTSLAGLTALPALTKLDASSNQLLDINGVAELPALGTLNLAKNEFEALEGPWAELANLTFLDVSDCKLATPKPLEVLRQVPKLRSLGVRGNPFAAATDQSARVEVLICHWRLSTIDGTAVSEAELEQAKELNVRRMKEEMARPKAEDEAATAGAEE